MPYRKKSSRTSRRPTSKRRAPSRRRTVRRRRTVQSLAPSGMPKVRTAHLRYVQLANFIRIDGTLGTVNFVANSAFAPSSLGTGFTHIDPHQPMGFDQWASLYNNYVVMGSKITVVRIGCTADTEPQPDQTEAGRFGVYLSDSATPAYTRGTSYKEARKGQTRQVSNNQRTAQRATAYYSPRRMYGIKDIKDNQDRLGANTSSNPTERALFILWAQFEQDPAVETTWNFEVTIEYCIQFDEPVNLEQSVVIP